MAKGFNQIKGLNYFDTYSHVAKMTIFRMVIALTTIHNCFIHQLDVNNAFMHGDFQEDVYMTLPLGITSTKPNKVCKLDMDLQSSRKWHEKLTYTLLAQHYKQANSDHSIFTKQSRNTFTLLLMYVDDIIIIGNSLTKVDQIKSVLHQTFQIKNIG